MGARITSEGDGATPFASWQEIKPRAENDESA